MENSTTNLHLWHPSTEKVPRVQKQLFIQSLPVEIQLLIVEACVVANPAVIEIEKLSSMANGKLIHTKTMENGKLAEEQRPLQASLALGILQSCDFYRKEGVKLFWRHNKFRLGIQLVCVSLCGPITWSTRAAMLIRHLNLKQYVNQTNREQLDVTVLACVASEKFQSLESLELDLVSRIFNPWPIRQAIKKGAMFRARYFYENFRQSLLSGPAITGRRLKHVTVTGLPQSIWGYLMIRILSTLLAAKGTIEFGMGDAGYRYRCFATVITRKVLQLITTEDLQKAEVERLKLDDVEGWIDKKVETEIEIPDWWTWFAVSDEKERGEDHLYWMSLVHMCEQLGSSVKFSYDPISFL